MPVVVLYVIAMLLFGCNGIIAAAIPFESGVIVLVRLVLGGGFLGLLLLLSRLRSRTASAVPSARSLRLLVLSGLSMGASWLFLYAGFQLIGVGMTTLLYYTGPVMLMTFLHLTGEDRFSRAQWIGLAAAAAGASMAVGAGAGTLSASGVLAGLLSAVSYAAMVWLARRAGEVDGLTAGVVEIGSALPLVLGYVFAAGVPLPTMDAIAAAWLPMLWLGVLNTGVGCALYFYAVSRLSASVVSSAGYLEPISALVFSAIFLNESLGLWGWTGAGLVLAGTILAVGRRS